MKKFYLFIMLFLVLACNKPAETTPEVLPPATPTPPPPVEEFMVPALDNKGYDFIEMDTDGWEMIWEDNFDDNLFDWNVWTGGAFNNELQYYQRGNLYVENDFLYIRQRKQSAVGATNPFDQTSKAFEFTSGRIETKTMYSPSKVGGTIRFAARIKLPAGEGLWPAFWSYGDPWPTQGEIDVMEYRGGETTKYSTNFFYGREPNQVLTNSAVQTKEHEFEKPLSDEFHVYELEWSRTELIMKLDGEVVQNYGVGEFEYVDDLFTKSQQVVLNLAVGGDFFQNLDESDIPNESYLVVDWVKIFKQ